MEIGHHPPAATALFPRGPTEGLEGLVGRRHPPVNNRLKNRFRDFPGGAPHVEGGLDVQLQLIQSATKP